MTNPGTIQSNKVSPQELVALTFILIGMALVTSGVTFKWGWEVGMIVAGAFFIAFGVLLGQVESE